LGLGVAPSAFAQGSASSKAAAEALFDEGVKQMKAGQFAEACPKLEESQRIDPGVGTLLYLAECYEKSGRIASAWATFREAASLAGASGQVERERTARDRAQKIEAQLSYITVVAAPETKALRGLTIVVGPNTLGSGLVGTPTPIDPGEQRIEVSAPGREPFVTTVKVETARRYEVNVPALREQPQAAPATQQAEPPPAVAPAIFAPLNEQPATPKANPLKTVGIVVGGVGLVGIGVGSYFGLRAISKMNEATDEGSCANGLCQDAEDLEKTEQASDAAVISNVAFAAGGALLVTGVALYVFAPDPKQQQGLRVSPYFTGREGGIAVGGRL
jgi:serine/threonine-protein kinase